MRPVGQPENLAALDRSAEAAAGGALPRQPRQPAAGERVTAENYQQGATVTRGRDWRYGDQDHGRPGTLQRLNPKLVAVVAWPNGLTAQYRVGQCSAYDLVYGTTPTPPAPTITKKQQQALTRKPVRPAEFKPGATVVRGPDWIQPDFDGRDTMTLLRLDETVDAAWVRLADGTERSVRCGYHNTFELIYGIVPSPPDTVTPQKQRELDGHRVTPELFVRGAVVSCAGDFFATSAHSVVIPGVLARRDFVRGMCYAAWYADGHCTEMQLRMGHQAAFDLVYGAAPRTWPLNLQAGAEHAAAHAGEPVTDATFLRGAAVEAGPGLTRDGAAPRILLRNGGEGIVWVRCADGSEAMFPASELVFVAAAAANSATSAPVTHATTVGLTAPEMASCVKVVSVGSGTFGTVYSALLSNATFVAVKEIVIRDDFQLETAMKEVNLLKTFAHPNIIRFLGCEHLHGEGSPASAMLRIFMEVAHMGSLRTLASRVKFTERHAVGYTRQILAGLKYLHDRSKPVLHRDIKCANILIDANGTAKLADFGCSKALEAVAGGSRAGASTRVGTAFWMAPEVARNERYDTKADIWSVGCTVVEMLNSGMPPFPPEKFNNGEAAMYCIGTDEALLPDIPGVTSGLCRSFIRRCLVRDAGSRADVHELLAHPWITQDCS